MYVMVWLYVRTYVAIRHEIGSLIKYVLFQVGVRWVANRSVWVIGGGGGSASSADFGPGPRRDLVRLWRTQART